MKKKAPRKKIETGKKGTESQGNEYKPAEKPNENEPPFDFGGLPQRDLKKNLGCG